VCCSVRDPERIRSATEQHYRVGWLVLTSGDVAGVTQNAVVGDFDLSKLGDEFRAIQ